MAIGPRLDLRQSQSLVMTPRLQQAIKLLALSNLEIEGFIAEEIEKNPLLEISADDDNGEERLDDSRFQEAPDFVAATSDELIAGGFAERDSPLDVDYDAEIFHHDSASDSGAGMDGALGMDRLGGDANFFDSREDFDTLEGAVISLRDHLNAQAGERLTGEQLLIAGELIDRIDEAGYLRADLLELSRRLGAPIGSIEEVLRRIQDFDPSGVGARNLAECLTIQAREADRYDPCMAQLIENLELVARGDLTRLRRLCRVDDEDLRDMIAELRGYDPKPGCRFGGDPVQTVVPDIFVAPTVSGWAIELNAATLPRLIVNRGYYVELSGASGDKQSRAWLNESLASANWLIKALDQRARTIVKVSTELVRRQEAFFRRGVEQLRPLTLREIADAIGMHESTVSRVTSNKYLSCARGVFELKYFFPSGTGGGDKTSEAASSEAIKSQIGALIADEDTILSDDKIVALLKARGFAVARRTVTKYREAIGIGSSVERRRHRMLRGGAR